MEKKVFVTGANGFIGQHSLIPLLEEGYTVYACCHHLPVVKIPDVHYITCDLRDDENIKKVTEEWDSWYAHSLPFLLDIDDPIVMARTKQIRLQKKMRK